MKIGGLRPVPKRIPAITSPPAAARMNSQLAALSIVMTSMHAPSAFDECRSSPRTCGSARSHGRKTHHPYSRRLMEVAMYRTLVLLALSSVLACSCHAQGGPSVAVAAAPAAGGGSENSPIQREAKAIDPVFAITEVASFQSPWAMAFLPDGRLLVTEKRGALKLVQPGGTIGTVSGLPAVDYGGQGGLGDVAVHPKFAENGWIYLSYVEAGDGDT